MMFRILAVILAAAAAPTAAQVSSFDLGRYRFSRSLDLPIEASEASAIAFNPDTGHLLVLGDEGDALVEITREGVPVSTMTLTGFDDTEGLTYIGGGLYVLVEERLQDVYRIAYVPNGSAARPSLPTASLGETVGNVGLEGITFDSVAGSYIAVKEKTPQAVASAAIDFGTGTAAVSSLFIPNLGLLDLSDVQALSAVPSLVGTPDQENLLIYSQESQLLVEVSRDGTILSQFPFTLISSSAEGVTIDHDGVLYVCDETPRVYVLTPCQADCNSDGALNLADFGCFQTSFALAGPYADCNGDSLLNLADFGCFQTQFTLGCQ